MTATLDNLIQNDNGLRVFCDHCVRCVDLDVAALVERYGTLMQLPEIGRRSRCKACGAKGGSVQVVVAMDAIAGELMG
jgi:hypothetical protein